MADVNKEATSEQSCYWKDVWQRLYTMRQMWQLCDLSLISQDGICFKAHSIVLAASSSIFYAHLINGENTIISELLPSELHLSGINADVLQVTLDFIYGIVPETMTSFKQLQKGADRLGISAATVFCRQQLNELEELAKGDSKEPEKCVEKIRKPLQENQDLVNKQKDTEDKVNFPKCPYLTNMTAESSHIIPLKKRFLLNVLSQLRHEEAPLASVIDGPIQEKSQITMKKTPERIIRNSSGLSTSVDLMQMEKHDTAAGTDGHPSNMPGVTSSSSYCSSKNPSKTTTGFTDITPTISHFKTGGRFDHLNENMMKHSDGDDVIPHPVPDLDFTDMGIQCPHLQRLVGQVDSYSGFPVDIIGGLDPSLDFDLDARTEHCKANNATNHQGNPVSASLASQQSSVSFAGVVSKVTDSQPNFQKNLIEYEQQKLSENNVSGDFAAPSDAGATSLLAPNGIGTSSHRIQKEMCSSSRENGKRISGWSMSRCDISSNTETTHSCPVKVQTTCDTEPVEIQKCEVETMQMDFTDEAESEPDSVSSYSQQDLMNEQHPKINSNYVQKNADQTLSARYTQCSAGNNETLPHQPVWKENMLLIQPMHPYIPTLTSKSSSSFREHAASPLPQNDTIMMQTSVPQLMPATGRMLSPQTGCMDQAECHSSNFENSSNLSVLPNVKPFERRGNHLSSGKNVQVKKFITRDNGLNHSIIGNVTERKPELVSGPIRGGYVEECKKEFTNPIDLVSESDSETSDNTEPEFTISPENKMDNKMILDMLETSQVDEKRLYTCVISGCDYTNKNIEYVQSHLYHRHGHGSPQIKCADCHRKYFSESQLRTHQKQTHEGSAKYRLLTCEDCEEKFKNSQSLLMHRLKAHGKGKLFSCEDCSFKSPRKKDLQGHMISQHGKAPLGVRVYQCELCEYKCIDRNRFSEHEASHTQQRSFQCDHCGNYYATRRGLRNHLKYHSNERPHKCNICNAAFKVRAKLRDHIRLLHLNKGEKPYKCGYCDFQAAVRGNVNQHIRNTHKGQQIVVIDLKSEERKHVKDYDYANMTGSQIKEVKDASAAGYASVGRL